MPCHRFSLMKDPVLRPFIALLSTVTEASKNVAKGVPHPVSGKAAVLLVAIVESPARYIVMFPGKRKPVPVRVMTIAKISLRIIYRK